MDEESDARGDGEDKMASTMERGLALLHSVRFVSTTRRRTKFVPFLLRNNAGLPLKFTTLTSIPSKVTGSSNQSLAEMRVDLAFSTPLLEYPTLHSLLER